jgi:hypothetical protein
VRLIYPRLLILSAKSPLASAAPLLTILT